MEQITKNIKATNATEFAVRDGMCLGSIFWDEYDVTANSTSTSWVLYREFVTPVLPAGSTFRLAALLAWGLSSTSSNFRWRFSVDGAVKWTTTREPQDPNNQQTNIDHLFTYHTLATAKALTLRIEFTTTLASANGYVQFSKMEGWRVK